MTPRALCEQKLAVNASNHRRRVLVACELSHQHPGPHLAAGYRWLHNETRTP